MILRRPSTSLSTLRSDPQVRLWKHDLCLPRLSAASACIPVSSTEERADASSKQPAFVLD